ncbi:flagellar hook-associated protein 2 [Paraliobacillus salinarum]|uniref:flagellar hook-associated protein 2 n=1 Tax=Paraliobacillus salinarum TaxID=1158996 RepID=UPI001FE8470F|nr:flagellar hook-associated protein 2 [Paraliobacillus salinarum]
MVNGINSNSMRIGGLASGIDTDSIIADLMKAERIPLQKMKQDKIWTEWTRDAYRELNTKFSQFDQLFSSMKRASSYKVKSAISSQSDAITAKASSGTPPGSYSIEVSQLATNAINVSSTGISTDPSNKIDPLAPLSEQMDKLGGGTLPSSLSFTTYQNDPAGEVHEIQIDATDSLSDVLTKISDGTGINAFYDVQTDKVVMETKATGDFNVGGNEIDFSSDGGFFANIFNITNAGEKGGTNAKFNYNGGIDLESKTNTTTVNGLTLTFNNVTSGQARISVTNDVDKAVDSITEFVNKYNELIESVNGKVTEKRHRDYKPLTEEQKKDMSESEIELWEEKAKSGMLKSDSMLSSALTGMRQDWYQTVDTGNADINHLSAIGITTSKSYSDNGKLVIDEEKLRAALQNDSDAVYKLFYNTDENNQGLVNRLESSVKQTMENINNRAGKTTWTDEQYTLGKKLKDMETRMDDFQERLTDVENRYWRQFTAMEKAIQKMNQQSAYLSQQFGGM